MCLMHVDIASAFVKCFVWRNHVTRERCYYVSGSVHVVMYYISVVCMETMYPLYYTASVFCKNAVYYYCIVSLHLHY